MDIVLSSSSSCEEDGFIRGILFSRLALLDDVVSDGEDDANEVGEVAGRPNKKRPKKYNEAGLTPIQQRTRDHAASPWAVRFFNAPLEVGSLAFDSFRKKIRVPYISHV